MVPDKQMVLVWSCKNKRREALCIAQSMPFAQLLNAANCVYTHSWELLYMPSVNH